MATGLIVFVLVAVSVSTAVHVLLRWVADKVRVARRPPTVRAGWIVLRIGVGSAVAASLSAVLFQVVVFVQLGYLDPFAMIALTRSAVLAVGIAVVVGAMIELASRFAIGRH